MTVDRNGNELQKGDRGSKNEFPYIGVNWNLVCQAEGYPSHHIQYSFGNYFHTDSTGTVNALNYTILTGE